MAGPNRFLPGIRWIGLTGGIASGKSTVARMLAGMGAHIIDADLLAREVVASGSAGLAQIAARWPDVIRDGALDRKALGAKIFADPAERAALNAIVHPLVAQASLEQAQRFAAQGATLVIYEAPLIVENGLDQGMNGLIVVALPEEVQRARLMAREGLSQAEAEARLRAQAPLSEKLKRATWVVDNSGELERTRAQVEKIWREIAVPEGR